MFSKTIKKVKSLFLVRISLYIVLFLALLAGGMSVYKKVEATATGEVSGFAWSATIGWISFSCNDVEVCGPAPYGVTANTSSGILSGYAWAPTIGWIKFDPAYTNCPVLGECVPTIDLATGEVSGFARACGGTLAGDCIDQTDYDNWDGWIQLSGTNFPSPQTNGKGGVTYVGTNNKLVGYAWGGYSVLGWIQFNPSKGSGVIVDFDKQCPLLGGLYNPGDYVGYYLNSSAETVEGCGGVTATCQSSGVWSNPDAYQITSEWYTTCSINPPIGENDCEEYGNNPCSVPRGGPPMACGEERKFYKKPAVPQNASSTATCDDNLNSIIRTCVNTETYEGLTGSVEYSYTSCRVNPGVIER